jgi:hypothetical protein
MFITVYLLSSQMKLISVLSFRKGSQKQSRGVLLHGQQHQHRKKTYQRGNFDYQQSSQTRHVFGSGSIKWGSLFKRQRRSSPSHKIGRIGASTTPHTNGNRQYHCHKIQQWNNKTKRTKAMDMCFNWIKDRLKQGQFNV